MACDFTNYFAEIGNAREIVFSQEQSPLLGGRKVITAVWL